MIPPIEQPLPDAFRRIRLSLAREPENPEGRPDEGYTFILPLRPDGAVDDQLYHRFRDAFRVVRHGDEETSVGHVIHGPGGSWALTYDIQGATRQEAVFRLKDERLIAGEYVSIERDGSLHPFKIVAIEPV